MKNTALPLSSQSLGDGQNSFGKETTQIVANPVNTVASASPARGVAEFLSGIRQFNAGAQDVLGAAHKQYVEAEMSQGVSKEIADPTAAEPAYTTDQTPYYNQGRMAVWGERKGLETKATMKEAFDKLAADPEALMSTDLKKWSAQQIQDSMAGVKDPVLVSSVSKHLFAAQSEILTAGVHAQEAARHGQLLADYGAVAEKRLDEAGYAPDALQEVATMAKARGLNGSEVAIQMAQLAHKGISQSNWDSAKLLDTPLTAFNGLTARMLAKPADKDKIDTLLGHASKGLKEQNTATFSENAAEMLTKNGVTEESLSALFSQGAQLKLSRAEVAAQVLSAAKMPNEKGEIPDVSILNKPMAFLGGKSVRMVSDLGGRSQADELTNRVASQQKAQTEEARKEQALVVAASLETTLEKTPEAFLEKSTQDIANLTVFNPAFKGTEEGMKYFKRALEAQGKSDLETQGVRMYNQGQMRSSTLTEGDKRKIAIKAEEGILGSGLNKSEMVKQLVALSSANNVPSPHLKEALDNFQLLEPYVKDAQGKDIQNPALAESYQILDALRRSDNPASLEVYAKGQDLVFLNTVHALVNGNKGMNLAKAVETAKQWSSPERVKQVQSILGQHKSDILDAVADKWGKLPGLSWLDDKVRNVPMIRAYAESQLPIYLQASGGDVEAATKALTTDIGGRFIPVKSKDHWLNDDAYAVAIPVGTAEPRETVLQAFQAQHEALTKRYSGQGVVQIVPGVDARGDMDYHVLVGGIPQEDFKFSDLISGAKKTSAIAAEKTMAARAAEMKASGAKSSTINYLTGKATEQQYQLSRTKEMDEAQAQVKQIMSIQSQAESTLQGNPNAPLLKGRGPSKDYQMAIANAVDNPGFAMGAAVEGIRYEPYPDNDGGVVIGAGYNTKHQSPEDMAKDFARANIPNSPAFINSVISGKVRLTAPQVVALHDAAFQRYQGKAKGVIDKAHPGVWDGLNKYQQAAMGQLAYNTGWNSDVLKKFMGAVAQGREEEAIANLKVVWHDNKGTPHVNTDMMRLVRAMWNGPDAFKATLGLGRNIG